MSSVGQVFERFFGIRREEVNRVLLMSTYLLLIIASYSITKAVRDSLFVTTIGPRQLPYVYLLIAVAMGLVSLVYSRAVRRLGLRRLIQTTSTVAVLNLTLFWLIFKNQSTVWFYVLYVWTSVFGAITASQFWLLATHVFNAREARRLFTWVGVGGILGGVLGGALTNRLAHWFGTESLLLVCAGMMTATLVLLRHVPQGSMKSALHTAPGTPGKALVQQVRQSRHLTLMVFLLSVAVVVEAFIDYQYKFVANHSIVSKDHLTAFFGSITFYVGLLSLLFQMLFTNRVLKRFGVGWAILLLPASLCGAFMALALRPSLWTAGLLQLVDGGFSYSIHRSGMELLYLPIPPETRNAVKAFIDTFVDRMGRAAGAVILLLCTVALALSVTSVSLIGAALAVAWVIAAVAVKKEYVQSFRKALEKRTVDSDALQLRDLDIVTMRSLLDLLSSEDEREVLYALDLLSSTPPNRWRQHVGRLMRHPSSTVRARTIGALAAWNDPSITRKEFIHHPDYETARIATATALRMYWNPTAKNAELLTELLHSNSLAVTREAMATAAAVGFRDAVPFLIEKLSDKHLRHDAHQALLKYGNPVVVELARRLSNPDEDPRIRQRLPKALGLTGKQAAADALLAQLGVEDFQLDYAILKALNRMRANSEAIVLDEEVVRRSISRERETYDTLRALRQWFEVNRIDNAAFALLLRALDERIEYAVERMCRLLGLIHSPHDIYSIYYNCKIKPALRSASIEFLDNLLDVKLKAIIVPVLEESFSPENALPTQHSVDFISMPAALSVLVQGKDPWLRAIAMELRNRGKEGHGYLWKDEQTPFVRQT
jgi:ATP/ADP translocase